MPRRDKNKVKEAPKSSQGMRVELVEKQLATYTTGEEIAAFTEGDPRPTILKVVEEAIVKLVPQKEKPPEEKPTVEKPPADDDQGAGEDAEYDGPRRFKLLRKAHRGPAYLEDGKMVRGPKYVKGDIVKAPEGTYESEIKRLFGNEEFWEEL